jgi:hypothetical protein
MILRTCHTKIFSVSGARFFFFQFFDVTEVVIIHKII